MFWLHAATEDTTWKALPYRMLRGRAVDRIWRTLASQRKLSMTSAGPSVDQLPPPPPGHSLLVEGQAAIPFSEGNEVFYNKVQVFNRDLSIHVIKLFAEKRLREKAERGLRKTRRVSSLGPILVCLYVQSRTGPLSRKLKSCLQMCVTEREGTSSYQPVHGLMKISNTRTAVVLVLL